MCIKYLNMVMILYIRISTDSEWIVTIVTIQLLNLYSTADIFRKYFHTTYSTRLLCNSIILHFHYVTISTSGPELFWTICKYFGMYLALIKNFKHSTNRVIMRWNVGLYFNVHWVTGLNTYYYCTLVHILYTLFLVIIEPN